MTKRKYNITGDLEQEETTPATEETTNETTEEIVEEVESEITTEESNELTEETEVTDEGTTDKDESTEETDESKSTDEEDLTGEVDITIEGESESEQEQQNETAQWIKDLRRQSRENQKRLKELERENRQLKQSQTPAVPILGDKPTLDGCDYDQAKYEEELSAWYDRKKEIETIEKKAEASREAEQKAWNDKIQNFEKAKKDLRVKDFDVAWENIESTLSIVQQGAIIQGAKDPAALMYLIGKSPERAAELASITDPVKFIFAVANLEAKLKVVSRKTVPATTPESKVTAPVGTSLSPSKKLEQLRAKAEKTGDYTEVNKFKREMRQTTK